MGDDRGGGRREPEDERSRHHNQKAVTLANEGGRTGEVRALPASATMPEGEAE